MFMTNDLLISKAKNMWLLQFFVGHSKNINQMVIFEINKYLPIQLSIFQKNLALSDFKAKYVEFSNMSHFFLPYILNGLFFILIFRKVKLNF